jgi:hypothetical protein
VAGSIKRGDPASWDRRLSLDPSTFNRLTHNIKSTARWDIGLIEDAGLAI